MTWKQVLGMGLISLPFIGILVFVVKTGGWRQLLAVLGLAVAIMGLIIVGGRLVQGVWF